MEGSGTARRLHFVLGLSLLKLRQPCEAIAPLESALKWPARPASTLVELGDANQGCECWEPAAKAHAEAARTAADPPRLLRESAHCWWMARRYDAAKPLFAALMRSRYSAAADVLYEYGDTLARLEGAASGVPLLEKAVAADPRLVAAHGALGRGLMELGRAAEAVPHLESAATVDAALLLPLSRAYRALNRPADAARAEAEYKTRSAAR